jgi:nitrogen fixation protein FixH
MLSRLLLALLALLALVACAGPSPAPGPLVEEQQVHGLTIGLEAPVQPKLNQAQDLTVTLKDDQGAPVGDAAVSFDLTMPEHPMGTNTPLAQAVGEGSYRASNVVMNMTGAWEIEVIANVQGREYRAVFKRTVVE